MAASDEVSEAEEAVGARVEFDVFEQRLECGEFPMRADDDEVPATFRVLLDSSRPLAAHRFSSSSTVIASSVSDPSPSFATRSLTPSHKGPA